MTNASATKVLSINTSTTTKTTVSKISRTASLGSSAGLALSFMEGEGPAAGRGAGGGGGGVEGGCRRRREGGAGEVEGVVIHSPPGSVGARRRAPVPLIMVRTRRADSAGFPGLRFALASTGERET